MSSDPQQNQRIRLALSRFSKIHKRWFWFRLLCGLAAYRARRLIAGLFVPPRSRVHWLGHHRRPRRLQRQAIVLLFLLAMTLLEPREYATWAAVFGGFTALTIPFLTLHRVVQARASR